MNPIIAAAAYVLLNIQPMPVPPLADNFPALAADAYARFCAGHISVRWHPRPHHPRPHHPRHRRGGGLDG
jgi:hypothetical protein